MTMLSSLAKNFRVVVGLLPVVAVALLISAEARAQVTMGTPLPAPPPLRLVPRDDRAQLDAARDVKARMRLSVELAEARLARAEQMTSSQQFEAASRELGIYQGILDDALRFLKVQKEQKKLREAYKRFEITLRAHGSRLETMRRTTPSEYAFNIKTITDYTKTLRGEALNGFYGDTVIRDDANEPEDNGAPADGKTGEPSQSSNKEQP
jgi:hypothetical protein